MNLILFRLLMQQCVYIITSAVCVCRPQNYYTDALHSLQPPSYASSTRPAHPKEKKDLTKPGIVIIPNSLINFLRFYFCRLSLLTIFQQILFNLSCLSLSVYLFMSFLLFWTKRGEEFR